jgi:hypothetical protein
VAAAIRHLAWWLAWQLGELERPLDHPPARITVISGNEPGRRNEQTA